jgi:hypothetical protein
MFVMKVNFRPPFDIIVVRPARASVCSDLTGAEASAEGWDPS